MTAKPGSVPVRCDGGAYYNENDKRAAAWLRELIAAGLIAPGVVDERSIIDVKPSDLNGFTQCHFFAGIGGWSYALRLAGWPDDRPIWTGSCPCQPFSVAGEGRGTDDPRHLWPAFRWLLAQCRPATVAGEQVASADGREWLNGVRIDLEALGYVVGCADLCAAGVGAPHIRQRLFWMADSDRGRIPEWAATSEVRGGWSSSGATRRSNHDTSRLADTESQRWNGSADSSGANRWPGAENDRAPGRLVYAVGTGSQGYAGDGTGQRGWQDAVRSAATPDAWGDFELVYCDERGLGRGFVARRIESGSCPVADGIPGRVGLLRGYGNAIVPQLAAEFIMAYQEATR